MGLFFDPDALVLVPQHAVPRLRSAIDRLWENRGTVHHVLLSEPLGRFYRRRAGRYRIIYSFSGDLDEMIIHRVGLREDVYQDPC